MPHKKTLTSGATPQEVARDLAPLVAFQEAGMAWADVETLLQERLLPHLMHYDSPTFQSMFNAFPEEGARRGAEMALAYNQGVTNWQVSPGGAMLEELCGRALCRMFGLAPTADATFMYSGTYANQEAIYLALHWFAEQQGVDLARHGVAAFPHPERLRLLVSKDAHFSVKQALRMLGLGEQCLQLLPVGSNRRVDVAAMRALVAELRQTHQIFCIVATAGTTSTGSIDPIAPLAELAREVGAWLHVDGAYGYAYKLVPEWAHLFAGDELADSISWDPHKQMGIPIPNSLLFVRRGEDFGRMTLHSGYFNRAEDVEPNPGLKSPPTTRPFSALPLVTSMLTLGLAKLRKQLRSPLLAVRQLAAYIQTQPDVELWHQPDTGIICFRIAPAQVETAVLSKLQRWLYEQTMQGGERSVSLTTLDGEVVLRLVVVVPTQVAHLIETVTSLQAMAKDFGQD
ncbi:MAG: aspartate aminotransferase family protein [Anaerolineales bacterium]|nr:aspartate aminotransferase family protein [Anaerolineales bacterium]